MLYKVLSRLLASLLLAFSYNSFSATNQIENGMKFVGVAAVVIVDDLERGRSDRWYFLTDHTSGKTVRLYFDGLPPESFRTGAQFEAQLTPKNGGYRPSELVKIEQQGRDISGKDVLQATSLPETRNILTILVDFEDAKVGGPGMEYGVTKQEVQDLMYHNVQSVAGVFHNASLGQLVFKPDTDADGEADVFGPYQIEAQYGEGQYENCQYYEWMDKADAAWQVANPAKDITSYQHILYILPNYIDWEFPCSGWTGIATLGCVQQCWAISAARGPEHVALVAAHEIGHNLWLDHAGRDLNNNGFRYSEPETDRENGDWSDLMGRPDGWWKFNAPHADFMDWTDPASYEIRPINQSTDPQSFELLSMDDEVWEWPGLRGVKLPRDKASTYYISYRLNAGEYDQINKYIPYEIPGGWANRINVHYNPTVYPGFSLFVTSLGEGETFRDARANVRIIAGNQTTTIDNSGNSTQVMGVEVCTLDCGIQTFTIDANYERLSACVEGGNASFDDITLDVRSFDGEAESVTLEIVSDLPDGLTGTILPKTVVSSVAGTKSTLKLSTNENITSLDEVIRIEGFPENGYPRGVDINIGVFSQGPGSIVLSTPGDSTQGVDPQTVFSWMATEGAFVYLVELSTKQDFSEIWLSQLVKGTELIPTTPLPLATQFFWRVTPINPCAEAVDVAVWSFTTVEEGTCPAEQEAVYYFKDDFEGANKGWEHEATIGPDTWELQSDMVFSSDHAWQASSNSSASDQRLSSPPINLTVTANQPKLEFRTRVDLELYDFRVECMSGGILEYSNDDGITWIQIQNDRLQTYPYKGKMQNNTGNPLFTLGAWCGEELWIRSLVDLEGLQGGQVRFRFRLGTGGSDTGYWVIDDVRVFSCVSSSLIRIFSDGFESD